MSTARLAGGTGSARSSLISPLASPEAPAQLDLRSFHRSPRRRHRLSSISGHFTARLAGGTGSARSPIISRSPRRRHRLSSISDHFTLASPEAPAQLALRPPLTGGNRQSSSSGARRWS